MPTGIPPNVFPLLIIHFATPNLSGPDIPLPNGLDTSSARPKRFLLSTDTRASHEKKLDQNHDLNLEGIKGEKLLDFRPMESVSPPKNGSQVFQRSERGLQGCPAIALSTAETPTANHALAGDPIQSRHRLLIFEYFLC
jgi:hypothetical protein